MIYLYIFLFTKKIQKKIKKNYNKINLITSQRGNSLDKILIQLSKTTYIQKSIHKIIYLEDLQEFKAPSLGDFCINIFIGNPDILIPSVAKLFKFDLNSNNYNIGFWFWELDLIPFRWRISSKLIDEVWVNSKFVEDIFKNSSRNVKKIPFLLEHHKFNKVSKSKIKSKKIIFSFVFDFLSFYDRKNPEAIVKAFLSVFSNNGNVCLLIKSKNGNLRPLEKSKLISLIGESKNIKLIDGNYSYLNILRFINNSNCYISLHRSEGFGMTLVEAMAFKVPVICTAYSGNMDFTNKNNSFLVKFKMCKIKSTQYIHSNNAKWAEPDIEDASKQLINVYNDYNLAKIKARKGKSDITKKYNYKKFDFFVKKNL